MDELARVLPRGRAGTDHPLVAVPVFEEFYEKERDGLFGALVLITGNRYEAEELTQEAFVAVWERWTRVAGMENPAGYLYRTAMNGFRKRRRRAAVALRRTVRPAEHRDLFAEAEDRQVVARALAGLSQRQRAALVLTDLLEFSSDEAGRMLSIRPATVRALASQGRAALRRTTEPSHE
jgi:RNA polymerase sigma-70 factor (ECF subfamily)